jgi:hypothetical protein
LTLDDILRDEIRSDTTLNNQSFSIKLSVTVTTVIFVGGLINSVFSFLTFKNEDLRQVGCGVYLLASSITSLLTISMLTIKFWFVVLTQINVLTGLSVLHGGCLFIEPILKLFVYLDTWLNACVAVERAIIVSNGLHFDKKKSKRIARWIIIILPFCVMITLIHEPMYRKVLIYETDRNNKYGNETDENFIDVHATEENEIYVNWTTTLASTTRSTITTTRSTTTTTRPTTTTTRSTITTTTSTTTTTTLYVAEENKTDVNWTNAYVTKENETLINKADKGMPTQYIGCVTEYSPSVQDYNTAILFFHLVAPFIVNLFSALFIIFGAARQRSVAQNNKSYREHIREQLSEHKQLIISSMILLVLSAPRLIIALLPGCVSMSHLWFYLSAYFISFTPSMLIFVIFVLPSDMYMKTFKESFRKWGGPIRQ